MKAEVKIFDTIHSEENKIFSVYNNREVLLLVSCRLVCMWITF